MSIVFLKDQFVEEEKALINATNRGFLFGDGVFTTMVVEDGKINFFNDHIKRLQSHSKKLKLKFNEIDLETIKELIEKNDAKTGRWRVRLSIAREGDFSYFIDECSSCFMLISIHRLPEKRKEALETVIYPYPIVSSLANVKTLSYFERFWVKQFAKEKNVDDCITRDQHENILEAAFANIFWIDGNDLYYPDETCFYLKGITLKYTIKAAIMAGYKINQVKAKIDQLKNKSLFLTSSTIDILPIKSIDNQDYPIGSSSLKKLIENFLILKKQNSI
jgi:branched-subunit amino acid aminotransferase/4-amino-4-deoxychorismate lyase